MVLREILFGAQKQAARQVEVVEEFVKNFVTSYYPDPVDWNDRDSVDEAVGTVLNTLVDKVRFPSTMPGDENYVSPEEWFYVRLLLGVAAVNDICDNYESTWAVDRTVQENGKICYFAYVCADEEGNEYDPEYPTTVDSTEADKIVEKVISYCPPSEREKLPADDKLAAVLLSRAYWLGKL